MWMTKHLRELMFYTISNENVITTHDIYAQATAALGTTPEALPATHNGTLLFQNSEEFTSFTMNCPTDRLVQIWNGLATVGPLAKKLKPVTKFQDRQLAAVRIWKAIQLLNGTAGGPVPDGAANGDASKAKEGKKPADETATKVADLVEKTNLTPPAALAQVKAEAAKPAKTPKAKKAATKKTTKPVKTAKKEATTSREGTAKARVIAMMQRKGGATLDSIMKETGWQKHTVRGFISILGSKHGLKIESSKRESDGARVYTLAQ
jgi:hypothetical protein